MTKLEQKMWYFQCLGFDFPTALSMASAELESERQIETNDTASILANLII